MFVVGVRKNICTAPFLKAQELFYLVGGGGRGGGLKIPFRQSDVWNSQNVLKFFISIEILEIQLFFSIVILPSIALKHWNFPDKLNFKGKTMAEFLLKSHFFSICNIWQ